MSIRDVLAFHKKFALPLGREDLLFKEMTTAVYRVNFLAEELDELREAILAGDRVKAFDALLDLEYVVHGTALFMGVVPDRWDLGAMAVHQANMSKERVLRPQDGKRNSIYDVKKPKGWISPEDRLREILSWTA